MLSKKIREYRKNWAINNKNKTKASIKKWRDNHKELVKKLNREYYNKNKDILKARTVEWMRNNPDKVREYNLRDKVIIRNQARIKARIIDITGFRCEICGSVEKLQKHHSDYNNPLQVNIFCIKHHKEWHKNNKPIY